MNMINGRKNQARKTSKAHADNGETKYDTSNSESKGILKPLNEETKDPQTSSLSKSYVKPALNQT